MAILKKTLFPENLEKFNVLIQDTNPKSRYFKITELPDTFTGGKNGFLIQGSPELVSDTIVKIEIKDALGNVIYHEPGEGIPEYYEGTSKVIAVYIYPDTAFGPCTITILGELKEYVDSNGFLTPVPVNWQGQYNVRWQTQINVNPGLANTTKIRFYRRPKIEITESVLPVYNRSVVSKTASGSVSGTPINPIEGSDYRTFKGIMRYELSTTSSFFSQSMENQIINISGLDSEYTPTITDVTTNTQAFVNVPYYITSSIAPNYYSVTSFKNKPFTLTFDESEILSNSNVSSSFATIKLTDLESFTGDPARIKVYASSRQDLGDYQLLQDVQLESVEIFLEREFENQLNVRTGIFTKSIIETFWKTENITTIVTASLDNTELLRSVKLLPATDVSSSVGLFKFYNSGSIDFVKNTEYALNFTPLLVSSSYYAKIEVYGSGSAFVNTNSSNTYGKLLGYLETDHTYQKYDIQQFNFKPDNDGNGNIAFVVKGGVWQLANISLRAAHESYYSPNEVTIVADVPTRINNETFDFKFELYDINNNYVPIALNKTFTFTGGNDVRVRRDLTLSPTFNQFNFTTASAFPTTILIDYAKIGLTGSITFTSQAVDTGGTAITLSDLTIGSSYPGFLAYVDDDTVSLSIESFTGSLEGGKKVGAISYTAQVEDIERNFTIYRADAGAPAYLFYANADGAGFTFDPDDNYKSTSPNASIDIRLVQQNLPALAPQSLVITSGSDGDAIVPTPPLYFTGSLGNASIYRLFVSSSGDTTPNGALGYTHETGRAVYDFTLYTVSGIFSSSVVFNTIIRGDKGKGLAASTDRNQFFYKMTDLSATPSTQTATILVKRQNLGSETNAITVTKVGSGPDLTLVNNNVGNGIAEYSLNTTNYLYTNGETQYTFTATDLNDTPYYDQLTFTPLISEAQISVNLTLDGATLPAYSNGFIESASFVLSTGSVAVKVAGEDITRQEGLSSNNRWDIISATETGCVASSTTPDSQYYSLRRLDSDSGSLSLLIRYKDGRGTSTDITKTVNYTKNKKAGPILQISSTPRVQSVTAGAGGVQIDSFANVTVSISEIYNGNTSNLTLTGLTATSADIASISTNPTTGLVTLSGKTLADATNATTVNISANVTDSEGNVRTITDTLSLSKVKKSVANVAVAVSPPAQSVSADADGSNPSTPLSLTVTALEAGTTKLTSVSAVGTNVTIGTITYNGASTPYNYATIPLSAVSADNAYVDITVNYTDSDGLAGSKTITATITKAKTGPQGATGATGATGTTGAAGASLLFRGIWNSATTYYDSDDYANRKDAVLYNGVYYVTKTNVDANVNKQPDTQTTFWEALGSDSFFTAVGDGSGLNNVVLTSSFNPHTSSINSYTASTNIRLNNIELATGSYAVRNASNAFTGSQIISGSLIVTGSIFGNVIPLSIVGGIATMDLLTGSYFTLTLANGTNTQITATNIKPGKSATLVITTGTNSSASLNPILLQPSGSQYTASLGSGKIDVLSLVSVNNTNVYVVSNLNMI